MENKDTLKTCLIISPIDTVGSEIRRYSDNVLKFIIRPVTSGCGYNAIRADEISEPGIITHQIIQHILEDDLVIADLTGGNPNVFYELAVRHAIRKPYIQIAQSQVPLPFDVASSRTILFSVDDLNSVDLCKQELSKQIKAAENGLGCVESPISVAIDILQISRSGDLSEKINAEIVSTLQDLRGELLKNLHEQSERITELQNLLKIDAKNDLKDRSSDSEIARSGKIYWNNFIASMNIFDRSNLVELLDDLILFGMPVGLLQNAPYPTSSSFDTVLTNNFEVKEESIGTYKIAFGTNIIYINKDDLYTFRTYLTDHGIIRMSAGTGYRMSAGTGYGSIPKGL